jgi:hypothetical protein
LHLKHKLHSDLKKSIIEGIVQYFKDRQESLNDYYHSNNNNKQNCDLQHYTIGSRYSYIRIILSLQQKEDCIISCGRWRSNILKLTGLMNLLLYYITSTNQTDIEH